MKKSFLKHGGDMDGFAVETGILKDRILDFSSNVNPLGVSPDVAKVYQESLKYLSQYPDTLAREFCNEVAARFSLAPDHVIAGNGAMALLDVAIRALKPRRALLIEPCFNEYRRLLALSGAQIESLLLKDEDHFNFPCDAILEKIDGIDLVVIGHPNNPTGTALRREEMLSLIKATERRGIALLLDEAFVDWNPGLSVHQEVGRSSYLIVIRSLTKFFGLAGVRAGFALAAPQMISRMRFLQESWSCNILAQRLSVAALRDEEFQNKSLAWFKEESEYLYQRLSRLPEIRVFPSLANFFLVRLNDKDRDDAFWRFMKSRGVYLRAMDDMAGLNNGYFRAALKTRRENLIFVEKLKEALLTDRCLSF